MSWHFLISLNRVIDSNATYILYKWVSCAFNHGYKWQRFQTVWINNGNVCDAIPNFGGPIPNFLSPSIVAYIVGTPLSKDANKNQKYKSACDSVSMAI